MLLLENKTNHQEPTIMTPDDIDQDQGVTFTDALQDKYCQQDEFFNVIRIPKDPTITTEIELIGFDKVARAQKQLVRLTSIDLSRNKISSAGLIEPKLRDNLFRVSTLNLDNNRLDWPDIVAIIDSLPNLKDLVISRNYLSGKFENDSGQSPIARSLSTLTVGHINLDWTSLVAVISQIWSCVDQLDLWMSRLVPSKMILSSHDGQQAKLISGLKSLLLSHNCFENIDWIASMGPLDGLTELDLRSCELTSVNLTKDLTLVLRNLKILNISNNNITDWQEISKLNALKSLNSLICHQNPFFILEKFAKSLILGRIAGLKFLNREEISTGTRRDSEILYLKQTATEYHKMPKTHLEDFYAKHPRFRELVDSYGLPENVDQKATSRFVDVNLHFQGSTLTKRLPFDMRISNLRTLCRRLFKAEPVSIVCQNGNISYQLDRDSQTLHFYSITNGSDLLIMTQ